MKATVENMYAVCRPLGVYDNPYVNEECYYNA